jgi:hypothetical protein
MLTLALHASCASSTAVQSPQQDHDAFFDKLASLQGQSFPGRTLFMSEPDEAMLHSDLLMHVAKVEGDTMHVRFLVGDDTSRTWILTRTRDGLHLRHRHLYPDGTPHDLTNYGGWAASGNPLSQSFPADDLTKELLPQASTNVWTMKFDTNRQVFIYDLQRHARPRYRAEFDLSSPM